MANLKYSSNYNPANVNITGGVIEGVSSLSSIGALTTAGIKEDTAGNLGLGVTPSAWNVNYRAAELAAGSFSSGSDIVNLAQNSYLNSLSNWTYKATAQASRYAQYQGNHLWLTAPSGTAGATITFTQAMTLDINGNLSNTATSKTGSYTVATLPAGVTGQCCYVTDALAPTWHAIVAGGGTVETTVFYSGAHVPPGWICT